MGTSVAVLSEMAKRRELLLPSSKGNRALGGKRRKMLPILRHCRQKEEGRDASVEAAIKTRRPVKKGETTNIPTPPGPPLHQRGKRGRKKKGGRKDGQSHLSPPLGEQAGFEESKRK